MIPLYRWFTLIQPNSGCFPGPPGLQWPPYNTRRTVVIMEQEQIGLFVRGTRREQRMTQRRTDWRLYIFAGFTACCMVGVAVCLICDVAISGGYTWSMLVLPSIVFGWLVCAPLLRAKRFPVRWCLTVLTLFILPYLAGLSIVLRDFVGLTASRAMLRVSLRVAPMAAVYLWLVYLICLRMGHRKWLAAGWCLALAVPLSAGISAVLNRTLGLSEGFQDALFTLPAAAACFAVDYVLRAREKRRG